MPSVRLLFVVFAVAGAVAAGAGCRGASSHPASVDAASPPGFRCVDCLSNSDCAGDECIQVGEGTACVPTCPNAGCGDAGACLPYGTPDGLQVEVCLPTGATCGPSLADGGAMSGDAGMCGALAAPSVTSCCHSCTPGSGDCAPNGCFGGWWCNTGTCHCQAPPTICGSSNGDAGGTDAVHVGAPPTGSVDTTGGTVSRLYFAVVGDSRPALIDDTNNYPSAVVQKLYQDLEALSPRPEFTVVTGDYNYAKATGNQSAPQIMKYLAARAAYSGPVFYAMGNHECTGYTVSNCGSGTANGITPNYTAFMTQMMAPLGQAKPYYTIHFTGSDGTWTAKMVVIAANAWDSTQSSWLDAELAVPTTYTIVVRHEAASATTAPGVSPSEAILAHHAVTVVLVGHTHSYYHRPGTHEVIMGLGGAPVSSGLDFGYLVVSQAPGGNLVISEYDYQTGATNDTFEVRADGTLP